MKKRNVKLWIFILCILAITLIMNGCADGDTQDAQQVSVSEEKNVLTIATSADRLKSLDKFDNAGSGADDTGYLWGDPLISTDHQGNYSPALATDWSMSADGLSYTFYLRENVKFHNGETMTSEDVKFTYERLLDAELGYTNSWKAIDYVEAPDARTTVIYLKYPIPTFYDEVGFVPIICRRAYEQDPEGFFQKPVGTGAYQVAGFDAETGEAHFVRNDNWWDENIGNVDEIVYTCIQEDTQRAAALQNGEADVVGVLTPDYHDILGEEFELVDVISDKHVFLGLQCDPGAVFAEYEMRAALSMCIDRQMLCDAILGGGSAANWPVAEHMLGYVDGYEYEYDMKKAKSLVETSDYDGRELIMIYSVEVLPRADEVAQMIQARAVEVGINLVLEPLDNTEFEKRRANGEYDAVLCSFAVTCGDPQTEAAVIIADDVFHTGYQNDTLYELCKKIRETVNKEEREKLLQEIFRMEMEEFAPFVYLYSPMELFAMAPEISNVTIYKDNSADYRFVIKEDKGADLE